MPGRPVPPRPQQRPPYRPPEDQATVVMPPLPGEPEPAPQPASQSLAKASGSMMIANLVSRVTGFVRQIMLVGVLGIGTINDSYTVSNNLPNIVYELLLGGVLASVVIPVLVRAQHEDADGGEGYTQRLLTVATVVLAVGTVIAIAASPLLTKLYFSPGGQDKPELTTFLSYLILPEIFFYGVFGLLSGILNARQVFRPAAWAPVANNLVMFVTLGLFAILPGEITLNPLKMGEPKLLLLGLGTTAGIVLQAVLLVPALRRTGFRFRWRWGWDRRMSTFGRLSLWLVVYTLISQVSQVVLTKVATGAEAGSITIYSNSWLLLQVPYGVLGVSLLTAIMPRLSKAAAVGDVEGVVANLSRGTRMSTTMLIPIVGLMTVLGPQIGIALFAIRHGSTNSAAELGLALTTSAFGIVFYGITMLQMRVFYAMNKASTPTTINAIMVGVKVILFYTAAHAIDPHHLVYALTFINGLGFIISMLLGQYFLRRRVGALHFGPVVRTIVKVTVATVWGAGAALLVAKGLDLVLTGTSAGATDLRAWVTLILGTLVGLPLTFGVMVLLRVNEIQPAVSRLRRLAHRG
ncbi:MAG TPA: murein biosynthesis integral membrane protein MurJ [Pseudonocardiaceae bacterium]|jgi:putative peptidoglycan lipid II flippase|nr:murein biosynthesis integral membrane protein MurJ [Pseudonocardiaceae bacterium]